MKNYQRSYVSALRVLGWGLVIMVCILVMLGASTDQPYGFFLLKD